MRILVTGAWQGFDDCKNRLLEMGHEICFQQWEKEPLPCNPGWPEGIIGNGIFLWHPIEEFVNLRYIQITSAGYDRVPMEYVREHGIEIHNARGVYSIPMAEYALGGILQLYKKFPVYAANQKEHQWNKIKPVRELYGKTVCIVGCGNVGTECAKRFVAVGCKVVGIDVIPIRDSAYNRIYDLSKIDETLEKADIIILTVPFGEETRNLLDKTRILSLKEEACIVNISRGGVMDYEAFAEIAPEKNLFGIFDVFPQEPLDENSPLWNMDNVIVTPHNSFQGENNLERLKEVIMMNLSI